MSGDLTGTLALLHHPCRFSPQSCGGCAGLSGANRPKCVWFSARCPHQTPSEINKNSRCQSNPKRRKASGASQSEDDTSTAFKKPSGAHPRRSCAGTNRSPSLPNATLYGCVYHFPGAKNTPSANLISIARGARDPREAGTYFHGFDLHSRAAGLSDLHLLKRVERLSSACWRQAPLVLNPSALSVSLSLSIQIDTLATYVIYSI